MQGRGLTWWSIVPASGSLHTHVYCAPSSLSQVLEQADCEALGMGAYLGVSQGACEPPKFIHLTYTPTGPVTKRISLVGKGNYYLITIDDGKGNCY